MSLFVCLLNCFCLFVCLFVLEEEDEDGGLFASHREPEVEEEEGGEGDKDGLPFGKKSGLFSSTGGGGGLFDDEEDIEGERESVKEKDLEASSECVCVNIP